MILVYHFLSSPSLLSNDTSQQLATPPSSYKHKPTTPIPTFNPLHVTWPQACEFAGHDESCQVAGARSARTSPNPGPRNGDMVPDLEPLFMKYGVDVYSSGYF